MVTPIGPTTWPLTWQPQWRPLINNMSSSDKGCRVVREERGRARNCGALGGGSSMSHNVFKICSCLVSVFLQFSCRFSNGPASDVDFENVLCHVPFILLSLGFMSYVDPDVDFKKNGHATMSNLRVNIPNCAPGYYPCSAFYLNLFKLCLIFFHYVLVIFSDMISRVTFQAARVMFHDEHYF